MSLIAFVYGSGVPIEAATALLVGNLLLRLGLSAVILVSGVGKFVDPDAGRQAMADFGVPDRWAVSAATTLPIVEIALGFALLLDKSANYAAIGLAILFCLFALGVGNLLRQDKAPPCNCFGAVHSEPVSGWTLFRVVAFAILALICLKLPMYPLVNRWWHVGILAVTYLAAGVGVKKWARRKKTRLKRLGVGQRLPAVTLRDGRWLQSVLPEQEKILLFLTAPGCCACKGIKKALSEWAPRFSGELPVLEIVSAAEEQAPDTSGSPSSYLISPKAFARFLSPTPGAFLVDRSGTILEPPAAGREEIVALLRVGLRRKNG